MLALYDFARSSSWWWWRKKWPLKKHNQYLEKVENL
jgi:hypothetical protein